MQKTVKVLSILLIALMLISAASTVMASGQIDPSNITANFNNIDSTNITNKAGKIIAWIRNIAAVAAVVIISILGIKYMIGSTEERADYKKSFIPLIVGIIVVLSATTIAGWIWSAVD